MKKGEKGNGLLYYGCFNLFYKTKPIRPRWQTRETGPHDIAEQLEPGTALKGCI